MGLPKVREGTYSSVAKSLDEYENDFEFVKAYLDHLKEENPIALALVLKFCKRLKGNKFIVAILGMCLMYKLLESEAEAEDFEKDMEASNGD